MFCARNGITHRIRNDQTEKAKLTQQRKKGWGGGVKRAKIIPVIDVLFVINLVILKSTH